MLVKALGDNMYREDRYVSSNYFMIEKKKNSMR